MIFFLKFRFDFDSDWLDRSVAVLHSRRRHVHWSNWCDIRTSAIRCLSSILVCHMLGPSKRWTLIGHVIWRKFFFIFWKIAHWNAFHRLNTRMNSPHNHWNAAEYRLLMSRLAKAFRLFAWLDESRHYQRAFVARKERSTATGVGFNCVCECFYAAATAKHIEMLRSLLRYQHNSYADAVSSTIIILCISIKYYARHALHT